MNKETLGYVLLLLFLVVAGIVSFYELTSSAAALTTD